MTIDEISKTAIKEVIDLKIKNKVDLKFIRERRLQLGLTLLEAARALGLKNAGNYYKYEAGEYQLSASMLPPLAKLLKCNINDFFCN